ncbi:MAG TPA: ATPase domain-containing protein [Candidatus Nanoarchaeia archaeon]|nr:ATPase domain-containing protein [Candidatus Nanoarchaeia archaeon]
MALQRVPFGIAELDRLISGGVIKNSINLVAGSAGAGKSIFALQFLVNGIKKYGEPGVYITFEEKKKKTYEEMLEFGWDLAKLEKEGKFAYLEYTPEQVKKVLVEGGGIVEAVIEKVKAKRIVIDSVTSFALLYEDELTKKEAALSLFELIDKWDCTGVLTSQDTRAEDMTISAALEFEVDSIFLLYHFKRKGVRQRAMEILKMRGTKIPEKTFAMDIVEKGIVVFPNRIVDV